MGRPYSLGRDRLIRIILYLLNPKEDSVILVLLTVELNLIKNLFKGDETRGLKESDLRKSKT